MPRPTLVRYVGLAGSVLLAVAAIRGGARSPWRPTMNVHTILHGRDGVTVPLVWFFGTALLIGAWWFGRKVVPSARWAYVTAALWVLPLLFFLPLGSYDVYSYACQGWQQAAGLDPYSGGVDVLGCPWASAVAPTWLSSPAPYGPVFLVLAGLAAKAGGSLGGTVAALRVIALVGVALIGVSLPAVARRAGVPLERAVWLALACPLVAIHLVSGAHNDALMVGLLVAGLALAADRRLLPAAVLFGLAAGIKVTAIVVVPFALWLVVSSDQRREVKAWARAIAITVAGVAGPLIVVSLVSGRGLGWVTGLMGSEVSVQWTAPSTAIGMVFKLAGINAVPVTRVIGIVLLAVVLAGLWWRAREREPLLYAGLALAATVVLAPVFHPWYAMWPLAVLAATVRRETRWLVIPPAVASALCLPDGYNLALATKSQGAILMTAFVVVVAGKAVHEAKSRSSRGSRPARDPDRLSRRDA